MFETWEELEKSIINCNKCKLCKTRQNIVFGVGNKNADIIFIGEGPGADEDRLGEPFVGRAGNPLLDTGVIVPGMCLSIIWFVFVTVLFLKWFERREVK